MNQPGFHGMSHPPRSSRVVLADMLRWIIVLLTIGLLREEPLFADNLKKNPANSLQAKMMWSDLQDRHWKIPGHTAQMCATVNTLMQSRTNDLVKLEARKLCGGKKIHTHSETQKSYNPYRDPIKNHYKKFIFSYTPTESTTYITKKNITTPTKTIFW